MFPNSTELTTVQYVLNKIHAWRAPVVTTDHMGRVAWHKSSAAPVAGRRRPPPWLRRQHPPAILGNFNAPSKPKVGPRDIPDQAERSKKSIFLPEPERNPVPGFGTDE